MKRKLSVLIWTWVLGAALLCGCGISGEDPVSGAAESHTLVEVAAVPPTAYASGNIRHWRCTDPGCGAIFSDFAGKDRIPLNDVTVAPLDAEEYWYHEYRGGSFDMERLITITNDHAVQGTAIYGDYLLACNEYGRCYLYTLPACEPVDDFPLGCFDNSDSPTRNHSNQMMFGSVKFSEEDPFPLLYVTTGYSNDHDSTGAYYAKCAVERIRYSESDGWYAETVQTIEFNDAANIPDGDKNGALTKMYRDGRFLYTSGNGYDASAGFKKIGYGWPHFYVDGAPTEVTEGKLYIFSARFRGSESWEEKSHEKYDFSDYYTDNNYIITELDLPALPESEADAGYGGTVTLYPKDITGQFLTEFDIYAFQGGTMYNGKIFHAFGDGKTDIRHRNGIRVFDIARQEIVGRIALHETDMAAWEPECCCIYNGDLALSFYNMNDKDQKVSVCVFGYILDESRQDGLYCLVCDQQLTP